MTVSSCSVAQQMKIDFNLSTYNDTFDCVDNTTHEWTDTVEALSFHSKFMTRDSSNPVRWATNGTAEYIFSNRIMTYIDPTIGQIYRHTATKQDVNFVNKNPWYHDLPVVAWFAPYIFKDYAKEIDMTTYKFSTEPYSSFRLSDESIDPTLGFVTIDVCQGERTETIVYSKPTVVQILSAFGGKAFAVVALFKFLLNSY